MQIDLTQYALAKAGQEMAVEQGRVRVVARSLDAAIWFEQEGTDFKAVIGFGKVDATLAASGTISCDKMCWVWSPDRVVAKARDGIWTNLDRKPHESGMLLEVQRAVRKQMLEAGSQAMRAKRELIKLASQGKKTLRVPQVDPDQVVEPKNPTVEDEASAQ